MEPATIVRRFDALKSVRKTVEEHWQLIERFVCPGRGKFFQDEKSEHELTWRRRELFDSTAPMASQTLAASLHGSLTSPAVRWFDIRMRNQALRNNQAVKKWTDEAQDRVYYALQDSNFNLEANEMYLDLVNFGASVLFEEPVSEVSYEGIDFQAIPTKHCFFEQAWDKSVIRFYRRFEVTASQMVDKFGDFVPDTIKQAHLAASEVDRKYEVIFASWKREEIKNADTTQPITPLLRPWGWRYILHDGAVPLSDEGGFYEMPAFVSRWRMMSGSMWGYSPAMLALPDILTLNQLVELILRSAEKVIDPATLVTERGLIGALDLDPSGVSVVRTTDDVKPYESGARFDVSQMQRENLQQSIRQVFHVDQLELKESPAMTATEVQVRYELMQRLLGPTLGRLQHDFLDPLIERTFMILLRGGQLPPPPDIIAQTGERMDIEYTGPLARAQKLSEVESTERWVAGLAAVAEAAPEVLDNFDPDGYAKATAEMYSVPATVRRSEEDVVTRRKQRQEQAQVEQALAMANQAGQAGKALGEAGQALGGNGGLPQ